MICVALFLAADFDVERASSIRRNWFGPPGGNESRGELERHFATWDAEHYLFLSEFGYRKGFPSCAFYPLWPKLIQFGAWLTGAGHLIVGLALATACSLLGWSLFYSVVKQRLGRNAALWSTLFLVTFPGSVFFNFVYSESLFLLLMVVLWRGVETRRYGVACIAAFLLPLARGIGVFAVIPLAWNWLTFLPVALRPGWQWLIRGRAEREDSRDCRIDRAFVHRSLLLVAPVLGWFGYLILMWKWTGNPIEGFEAQKYWLHTHSVENLIDLPKFILGYFEVQSFHSLRGSLLDRLGFLLLLLCLPVIWRQGRDLFVWTIMLGLIPALSGTFASFVRFEALVFPLFIALGEMSTREEMTGRRWVCLSVFGLLHATLSWRFLNYYWAG